MIDQDSLSSRIVIPEQQNILGWTTRIAATAGIAISLSIISGRTPGNGFAELNKVPKYNLINLELSPDGQSIAYVQAYFKNGVKSTSLTVIDPRGNPRVIAEGEGGKFFDAPVWSPDGKKLAFDYAYNSPVNDTDDQMNLYNNSRIRVYDVKNGTLVNIDPNIKGEHFDTEPKWTPDGNNIVFRTVAQGKESTITLPVPTP